MTVQAHPIGATQFNSMAFDLLLDAEGLDPKGAVPAAGPFVAYYDSKGILTIGIGFNLSMPAGGRLTDLPKKSRSRLRLRAMWQP
jgi:hypothetical protein